MPIIRSSRLYVLLPPMVCSAWLLVVGGQEQGSRLCVQEEGWCMTAYIFCIYSPYISCYPRSTDFYLTQVFMFSWQGLFRWRSLRFLHDLRQKSWSDILMHMLSPSTGWVHLVQVYAEVTGRTKCVNYIGRVNRLLWAIRATQRVRGSTNPKASILCDSNEKQHFAPNKFTL